MNWYRWWHGSITDPKLQMVANESAMPLASIIGLWAAIIEHASLNDPRGQFKFDEEVLSFHLGIDVVTPCNAMKRRGLLHVTDGVLHISNWEKRQPKREREDDSSERVKKHRDKKKQELEECNATVTPRNANVTHETPRGEEIRGEKKEKHAPAAAAPSDTLDFIWKTGTEILGEQARPLIGKARKAVGDQKVTEVLAHILSSKPPISDPLPYFIKATSPRERGWVG